MNIFMKKVINYKPCATANKEKEFWPRDMHGLDVVMKIM